MVVRTPLGLCRPREGLDGFRKTSLSLITLIYPSMFPVALTALRQIGSAGGVPDFYRTYHALNGLMSASCCVPFACRDIDDVSTPYSLGQGKMMIEWWIGAQLTGCDAYFYDSLSLFIHS
jgi:hypothetical protein